MWKKSVMFGLSLVLGGSTVLAQQAPVVYTSPTTGQVMQVAAPPPIPGASVKPAVVEQQAPAPVVEPCVPMTQPVPAVQPAAVSRTVPAVRTPAPSVQQVDYIPEEYIIAPEGCGASCGEPCCGGPKCCPPCVPYCKQKKQYCKTPLCECPINWCKPWTCADLEMKPFECKQKYCGCKGLFHCYDPDKDPCACKEEKKVEEKKEEECPGCEPAEELTPLMQMIACCSPKHYERMKKRGDNFYGWIQMGLNFNIDSPRDRVSYGNTYNFRSNDYRLDQVYFVFENELEQDDTMNFGYRVDFFTGHDAPLFVSNGLFDQFTGPNPTNGFGRNINRIGIDLPQFYIQGHIPGLITDGGVDIRFGKFFTLMGYELFAAPDTQFYTHQWESFFAVPFTNTGMWNTWHVTETVDVNFCVVRGWDQFDDFNNRVSYMGSYVWNSCDKRTNWTTAFITGPEQVGNNGNYRSLVTSYLSHTFGYYSQWQAVFGGHFANEANAFADPEEEAGGAAVMGPGNPIQDAQWYGCTGYLFYTINPKWIIGQRAEWWRDDDGVRTGIFNRPGFAASFYSYTFGITHKPYQNFRIRPECRIDFTPDARPFNDQTDKVQFTAAIDAIWQF